MELIKETVDQTSIFDLIFDLMKINRLMCLYLLKPIIYLSISLFKDLL